MLFSWPQRLRVHRIVPKEQIIRRVTADAVLRRRFVDEVSRIRWAYKLSEDALNLTPTPDWPELQVFHVQQKTPSLHLDVLRAIDRAIPSPIIFECTFEDQTQMAATWKRPNLRATHLSVTGDYFQTAYQSRAVERQPLPTALSIKTLYERIFATIIAEYMTTRVDETLYDALEKENTRIEFHERSSIDQVLQQAAEIRTKIREVERLHVQVRKTRQFNRRVEAHQQLKSTERALYALVQPLLVPSSSQIGPL